MAMVDWMTAVAALAAIGVLMNTGLILRVMWQHDARHSRIEHIDRRVAVLEERLGDVQQIKAQLTEQGRQLSGMAENQRLAQSSLRTIQNYLMERNP